MEEDNSSKSIKEEKENPEEEQPTAAAAPPSGGGGWGGWGFSPLSVFSDLQKAAAVAAEEISRNVITSFISKCFLVLFLLLPRVYLAAVKM